MRLVILEKTELRRLYLSKGIRAPPSIKCKWPFPTYFISHGGPSFLYKDHFLTDIGAYEALQNIGGEIKKMKPDYIIVVSGHYQSDEQDTIEVSINKAQGTDYENRLIYDFYGFPESLYKEKFNSKSNPYIGVSIYSELTRNGFKAKIVDRGIDHGVWIPFKIMLGENVDIPIIEVSLPYGDDFDDSYKLGKVLRHFREELIWDATTQVDLKGLVICSGTSVHNLRDIQRAQSYPGKVMPYVSQFHELIANTFNFSGSLSVLQNLNNLKKDLNFRQLLFQAHPTLDHFLPLVVAAGSIVASDHFKELYSNSTLSLGWGMYQFGEWKKPELLG